MGLEKKLGLGFVGMLFLAFCGVLTMRLADTTPEEKVDINIGAGATHEAMLAQPTPPAATGDAPFANRGGPPSQSVGSFATNNRPTQPNVQAGATPQAPSFGGGSRYATPSSSQAALPSPGFAPPTVSGVPPVADVERSLANSQRYAAPPPPATAAAPVTPPATVAGANPLRETTPSVPPAAAMPANDRYATPNIGTTSTAATREPRALDTGIASPQPLAGAAPPGNAPPAMPNLASSNAASPNLAPTRAPGVAALAPPGGDGRMPASSIPSAPMTAAPIATAPTTTSSVAPASAVAPVASGRDQPYVVAPGDNLFEISRKVYGDGSYYRALFAYNSDRYPHAEDIRSGNVLDVPPADYLKQRYPELIGGASENAAPPARAIPAAGSSYTVREGDTLFDIARKQLGQASRWTELYELNRATLGDNLENLRPGVTLRLP